MEKEEATRTLVKILAEEGQLNIRDSALLQFEVDNALGAVSLQPENDKIPVFCVTAKKKYGEITEGFEKEEIEFMNQIRANYLFVTPLGFTYSNDKVVGMERGTPFGIIGKKEASYLKRKFYKNVPDDVKEAFNVLSIKNYIELYQQYMQDSLSGCVNQRLDELLKRTPASSLVGKKVVYLGGHEGGISIGETGVFTGKENDNSRVPILWDNFSPDRHDQYGPKGHCWWVDKSALLVEISVVDKEFAEFVFCLPLEEQNLNKEFAEFVFCLPLEEQNLKANKNFIKGRLVDGTKILEEQYIKNPGLFKEYFSILKEEEKQKVVEKIKTGKQDDELNHWLFKNGFIEGKFVKHLSLFFKYDPTEFFAFFKKADKNAQKRAIKDILGLKEDNPSIRKWLSDNYPSLVTEAGREYVQESSGEENG